MNNTPRSVRQWSKKRCFATSAASNKGTSVKSGLAVLKEFLPRCRLQILWKLPDDDEIAEASPYVRPIFRAGVILLRPSSWWLPISMRVKWPYITQDVIPDGTVHTWVEFWHLSLFFIWGPGRLFILLKKKSMPEARCPNIDIRATIQSIFHDDSISIILSKRPKARLD